METIAVVYEAAVVTAEYGPIAFTNVARVFMLSLKECRELYFVVG